MNIEKGIPIPPALREPKPGVRADARAMAVGESIFFERYGEAHNFKSVLYQVGAKATIRKLAGGWRVWKR